MTTPGRKPRQITVRTVGTYSDVALAGFAKLIFDRERARSTPTPVTTPTKKAKLSGQ